MALASVIKGMPKHAPSKRRLGAAASASGIAFFLGNIVLLKGTISVPRCAYLLRHKVLGPAPHEIYK